MLRIVVGHDSNGESGVYEQATEVGPDGVPMYQQRSGRNWLFSGTVGRYCGRWCVGDVGKKYEQFVQQSDNSGLFMSSCHPHEGRPPQLVTEWFINYGNHGEVYVTEVREAAF